MSAHIPWFRGLYEEIVAYRRRSLFHDILNPWIEKAQPAMVELDRFKECQPYDRADESAQEAMWNLYALSRVNDLLLASFQGKATERKMASVSREEYEGFFSLIGFTVVSPERFSPFHHEIVLVHQSDDDNEPIQALGHLWPGLMFGEMLFSRSGVEVIGGRKHVVKDIAERSTLYFTFRREHRKTDDLSVGWGSNSQWRTNPRRDYQTPKTLVYNVDGNHDLNAASANEEDRDGLTRDERLELCRNRCFIVTSKEDGDLWPYDDRLDEPIDQGHS